MFGWWRRYRARADLKAAFFASEKCDYEKALEILTRALELDPNLAAAYDERGYCYNRLDRLQDAAQAHAEAVKLAPDNPKFQNNLLNIQFRQGKLLKELRDKAIMFGFVVAGAEQILNDHPQYPSSCYLLAEVLAYSSAPESVWERLLDVAAQRYRYSRRMSSGLAANESAIADVMTKNIQRCQQSARDGRGVFAMVEQPIKRLSLSAHYDQVTNSVGGPVCDMALEGGRLKRDSFQLSYEWHRNLSDQDADKLDSRLRAYACAAIVDAAKFAGLKLLPGPPHGMRPSWMVEPSAIPLGLRAGERDLNNKICHLEIGAIMRSAAPIAGLAEACAALYWAFSCRFNYIRL